MYLNYSIIKIVKKILSKIDVLVNYILYLPNFVLCFSKLLLRKVLRISCFLSFYPPSRSSFIPETTINIEDESILCSFLKCDDKKKYKSLRNQYNPTNSESNIFKKLILR